MELKLHGHDIPIDIGVYRAEPQLDSVENDTPSDPSAAAGSLRRNGMASYTNTVLAAQRKDCHTRCKLL
jgi:hypothetical protein